MRLLQLGATGELTLTRDISYDIPPYAILSHTWGTGLDDEVTLQDIKENKGKEKPGYQKILFCGQQAERDGLDYFWVDTCCIDKTSSAELTEAINSMFRWYQKAQKCYVYLADVSNSDREADEPARSTWKLAFRRSKWFSRGWTLQELIAPRTVEFFSSDCQRLGDKQSLAEMIHEITNIPTNAFHGASLAQFSVEERISWSIGRTTTRGEDKAYSLLGILDVSMTSIYGEGETKALERLRAKVSLRSTSGVLKQLPVAIGAAFDSHAEEHNQQCLAGTRTEILSKIDEWVHDSSSQTVYWLNGMAGTGKSTISRTLAQQFSENNGLGATFFFKRGEGDVGGISKFFTTIVSQLIQRWPGMAGDVQAIIEADPAIVSRAMREQFQKLIIDPMSNISFDTDHYRSCLIIIDALDECEPQEDVKSVINLLSSTKPLNSLHLKFFLTSRPELPIRMGFQAAKGTYQDFILHEVAQSVIEHDLTAYLKYELGKIREDFNQNGQDQLPADWPSQTALEMLVQIAIPLFISAATISRFIADSQLGNPEEQLEKVLTYEASDEFEFDMTYSPILHSMISKRKKTVCEQIVARFKTVVGSIIVLASPLSVFALAGLLDCKPSTIDATLVTLHSVLSVSKLPSQPIRLLHLSFRDFLVDPARRDDQFWIDEKQVHKQLASHCLRVLNNSLRTDICKVTAPGTPASSISDVDVNTHILPELQYACRFWVYHIHESLPAALDMTGIWRFLSTHFLQWLEALSWMCRLSESLSMIKSLQSIIPRGECPELDNFISDSLRFMQSMNSCIQAWPLQVYSSALILSPSQTVIRNCFRQSVPSCFALVPRVPLYWSERLATLEGHSDSINSVTFSPDGKQVASASHDGTVILWDVDTCERRQTLEGHSHYVWSVAFSPDGTWIASASEDHTVILWAANTGEVLYESGEYSSSVKSVVYSPNNELIAISLEDGDITLGRVGRHEHFQTLIGHCASVNSVAFSPDSELLASASDDETIMLWVTKTGERRQTLEGHEGKVRSVAFSPDGSLLVSAAIPPRGRTYEKETVILWVAETGEPRQTLDRPFMPHFSIKSVAFSPDGKLTALASTDGTVVLWATETGERRQTLRQHSIEVNTVAFSPDGTLLASASSDMAVILWAVDMNEPQQMLSEHSWEVSLIVFSPDGRLVASAGGMTVILWDASTGECRHILEGHSQSVNTIEFSPNSQLLTSGSRDGIGITWETDTGERRHTLPVKRHTDVVFGMIIAFSPNGELMASLSHDKAVDISVTDTGEHRQTLKHSDWVSSIAFSHSGKLIASGSHDTVVTLWVIGTSDPWQRLEGHEEIVGSVTFSPNDQLVVSGASDGSIIIWATNTGERLQTLNHSYLWVRSIAFSSDGKLVASSATDETVIVWAVDTGQRQQMFELGTMTNSLRFDERNEHILTDVGAFAISNSPSPSSVRTLPFSIPAVVPLPTGASPVGYGISQDRCWLTLHGEMFLWLPQEYRPECCASLGSTIAIGCKSGRVFIFRLN